MMTHGRADVFGIPFNFTGKPTVARSCEPAASARAHLTMAIAIFTTWTTYGTWLPGDDRGWYQPGVGIRPPDPALRSVAAARMIEPAVTLDDALRALVESTIRENCRFRGWTLHAVNCRSNHVHVAVSTPPDGAITEPRETFKAWTTRRLRAASPGRRNWWTERGWDVWIDTEEHLENVIRYIVEGQDCPR